MFTPHYLLLNALGDKYAGRPFQVLGFPSNQFGLQEPGDNATEIFNCLKYVRPGGGFEPNFELFAKPDVNGENQNPIYEFLKGWCRPTRKVFSKKENLYYFPYHSDDIRWNFEKFLLDSKGHPVRRYDKTLDPMEIVPDIDILLDEMGSTRPNRYE